MERVSTAAVLLKAMNTQEASYGFLSPRVQEDTSESTSLWNIPGLGIIGLGSAIVAAVTLFKSMPALGDMLGEITDFFTGSPPGDPELEKKAEAIGAQGEKYEKGSPKKDGEPRIASAEVIKVKAPKAEVSVPDNLVAPVAYQPQAIIQTQKEPRVSKAADLPTGSGMPLSSNSRLARPSDEIRNILQNTAKKEGIDFGTLYAVAGSESSFSAGAKAGKSSATGLFQFTAPTWTYLTEKVYPELRYKAGDRTNPEKSATMAAKYLKDIRKSLADKIGGAPTIGQTYLGFFMGPTGAAKFIEAQSKNPYAKGANVFPNAAASNPQLFYQGGDKSQPLTLQQTMDRLEGKVNRYYAEAQVLPSVARIEVAPPVSQNGATPRMQPVSVAGLAQTVAQAQPKVLTVQAPDFDSLPSGPKAEQREVTKPNIKTANSSQPAQDSMMTGGSQENTKYDQLYRDKKGRLLSIKG
jgi:soluble lytic murein transglycosylase-like protein